MKKATNAFSNPIRPYVLGVSFGCSIAFITVLSMVWGDGLVGKILLDYGSTLFPPHVTVQNIMWVMFFLGSGEIWIRYRQGTNELDQVNANLLPEDGSTLLEARDLGDVYKRLNQKPETQGFFLQRLVSRVILQFQGSQSIDQANSLMNSSLEMYHHEVDLKYNLLRYIAWLIPTLGFIGTVIGIAAALNDAGSATAETLQDPNLLIQLTQSLGVAFYTTLLALIQSAVLVFLLNIVQTREEMSLNLVGQYCLDNLINRLYTRK